MIPTLNLPVWILGKANQLKILLNRKYIAQLYMKVTTYYKKSTNPHNTLSEIKGPAMTSAVKCAYTGPIGKLTNTNTSQNTKHKKGFNIHILCMKSDWFKLNMSEHCIMSQRNFMISPTLSSNISFHSDVEIHYMDITAPHKQEQEYRLRHSHTTHNIHMWVSHLIVEVLNLSAWHVDLGHLLYTYYSPLLQW